MKYVLTGTALATMLALGAGPAAASVTVGFMLPYSGPYAALGPAIENGFKLYVQEQGDKLAGQDAQYFQVANPSNPQQGPHNATLIIKPAQCTRWVGTVNTGSPLTL